jgi:hypothetical protein
MIASLVFKQLKDRALIICNLARKDCLTNILVGLKCGCFLFISSNLDVGKFEGLNLG